MKKSLFAFSFLTILISILIHVGTAFAASNSSFNASARATGYEQVHACEQTAPGFARCLAITLKPTGIHPATLTATPAGLTPNDLQHAYQLPSATAGKGQTIAIVDAYDDPQAESDLAVYRSTFGLPPCTRANHCFKKVGQRGNTHYPQADAGWAGEIALDLDMVSAIAPHSHILLVEANSDSFKDLGSAVNTAVRLGATEVSNSYGGQENSADASALASDYNHAGVAITASSGDTGYGVQLPAAFNSVIAVGGTSLSRATSTRGWIESAWGRVW